MHPKRVSWMLTNKLGAIHNSSICIPYLMRQTAFEKGINEKIYDEPTQTANSVSNSNREDDGLYNRFSCTWSSAQAPGLRGQKELFGGSSGNASLDLPKILNSFSRSFRSVARLHFFECPMIDLRL